jgi:hypothetical protein
MVQAPHEPWPSQPLRTERMFSRRSRLRTRSSGRTSKVRGVPLTLTEILTAAPLPGERVAEGERHDGARLVAAERGAALE